MYNSHPLVGKTCVRPWAYFFGRMETAVNELMQALAAEDRGHPEVESGDTVKVHVRIVEGDRERIQVFQGVVIRLRKGGNDANFTVRRIASHGIGVERTFLLKSPRVDKIEILRRAKVRRAQLYYLRERRGKSARLKERRR
jgi:large subunit ribosomal protein L19